MSLSLSIFMKNESNRLNLSMLCYGGMSVMPVWAGRAFHIYGIRAVGTSFMLSDGYNGLMDDTLL